MEHEGHRKRYYEKLRAGTPMPEHELLEGLLFNAFPRKNTNPIAHALLEKFGSLKGVFLAEIDDLKKIDGVGDSVACYLRCVGLCAYAAFDDGRREIRLRNYGEFKRFVTERLKGKSEEVLEFYLCDKAGKVLKIYSHTDNDEHRVSIKTGALSAMLAASGAYGVIVAHNHVVGSCAPSSTDDKFTCEAQLICSMNGVKLLDHCVYGPEGKVFSYFDDGRIDAIQEKYAFENVIATLDRLDNK